MPQKCSSKQSKTNLIIVLVATLALIQHACSQQQPNLLVNGDFSLLRMDGIRSKNFILQMPGWNCTRKCQVNDCLKTNQHMNNQGRYGVNCTGLVVDLISDELQNLSQNVILDYEYYTLSLNYYYPLFSPNMKTFQVYFNEQKIFSFRPTANSNNFMINYLQKRVEGVPGINTLRLTTKRNAGLDTYGFFVNNIKLQKMVNNFKSFVNNSLLNDFGLTIAQIPGSRVIFSDLMAFFVNFDRLQFYYFHNRDYSQYSTVLLTGINILNDLKGLLFQNVLQQINPKISSRVDSYFSSIDYKYQYTPQIVFQRNESGSGFVTNCYSFFVYTLPGTVVIYLFLLSMFKLVRKRPASQMIRKFSFLGILMLMIFEGNVESLTYYSIGEMTLFFSSNLQHRFINVFIVYFQLITTIFSVGSPLLFKFHYRRLIFYFIEDKRNNIFGILCQTVDNGIICLLFGIVHQILFQQPQVQLLVLIALQCSWMFFKICLIIRKVYKKTFTEFVLFVAGLVRICFIITFYFYKYAGEMRGLINDTYHKGLIIALLVLWAQQLIVSFAQIVISVPRFLTRIRLIKQRRKVGKQKKQEKSNLNDALEKIKRKILENLKSKNENRKKTGQSSVQNKHNFINPKLSNNKCKIQPQKVRIAQLIIRRLLNQGHHKNDFK